MPDRPAACRPARRASHRRASVPSPTGVRPLARLSAPQADRDELCVLRSGREPDAGKPPDTAGSACGLWRAWACEGLESDWRRVRTVCCRGSRVNIRALIQGCIFEGGGLRAAERLDGEPGFGGRAVVVTELAVVQLDDAVGDVEVAVVVTDDDHGLAARFQLRQQLVVEDVFEERVLIRRPLVENVDGAILKIGREQREAFALALRQLGRRELPVLDLDLVLKVKLRDVLARLRVEV